MSRLTTARREASALQLLSALVVAAAMAWGGPAFSVESVKPSASKVKKSKPPLRGQPLEVTPARTQPSAECKLEAIDPQSNRTVSYSVQLPVPGSKQRVSACLLPAKQAITRVAKGELLLVDVRHARAYEQYRVAGSLNVPLAFVKTKSFLKSQAFALVNEGRESAQLEAMCEDLRAQGFGRATVLHGGLNAWRRASGTIDGDVFAQRELTRMHHAELAEEGNYSDWIVVSIATAPVKEVQALLPSAVMVTPNDNAAKLAAAVRTAVLKRVRKGLEPRVLVVDDNGERYDRIEGTFATALPQSVFFLEGGLSGYRKFWGEQATIWAAAAKPPRKPPCGA